jgi:archaellum component FlaF (FlaF/FlaG flagellin family)
MLSDSIMAFGVFFLLLAIIIGMVLCLGLVFFAFGVQAEAQSIAVSEGRMGYYTTEEQAAVNQYIDSYSQQHDVNPSDATVTTSNPDAGNPALYGTNVTASLSMPYRFQLGSIAGFTVTVTGNGRSISAYIPALQ